MDLFKRKSKDEADLECKICHLKFSDPERTMRHMLKAHSKPQKGRELALANTVKTTKPQIYFD